MRQIIYTHTGHNVIVGNFESGDTARLPDDLARHFVEEAQCAQYDDGQTQPEKAQATSVVAAKTVKATKGGKK